MAKNKKGKKKDIQVGTNAKKGVVELKGVVEEALPNGFFRITLEMGNEVRAHLSGKMRMYRIRVLPGDEVIVEFSMYDMEKGRITKRL